MEFAALTESVAFIPIPRNLFSFCSCISARLRLHGEMIYGDLRPEAERLVRVFYSPGDGECWELCTGCIRNCISIAASQKPDCFPLFLTTRQRGKPCVCGMA